MSKTENPLERRRYAQQATAGAINGALTVAYPYGTVFVGAWGISTALYTAFDLPASEFVAAEVSDPGNLLVNLGNSINPGSTELWKVRDAISNEVLPVLTHYGSRFYDAGYGIIIVDFPE